MEEVLVTITRKEVEYTARLARLEFSDDEKEELISELNDILGYVDKLNEICTEDEEYLVNPYYVENRLRDDEVVSGLSFDEVLSNSPHSVEEYIAVPI